MMTKTKFTQGPWTIYPEEVDKPYIRIRGTQLGGRFKIANVCNTEWVPQNEVQEKIAAMELEETRANARLIAKAPEMYALLEEILATQNLSFIAKQAIQQIIKEINA